jgi:hypothetical protein
LVDHGMSRTRLREAHIPLLLWLPAAAMLHLGGGQGASEVARNVAEKASILRFSRGVRSHVSGLVLGEGRPTEIEVFEDTAPAPEAPSEPSEDAAAAEPPSDAAPPADAEPREAPAPVEPPSPAPATPEPKPPDPEPKPSEPQPKPPEEVVTTPPIPAPPVALPNGRIAVQNEPSLAPNQPDNPDAARIADQANRTEEETQASHRSYDQNTSKPDGGGQPTARSTDTQEGNAEEDRRGHSVESPGEGPPRAGAKAGPRQVEETPVARSTKAPEVRIGRAAVQGTKGAAPVEGGKGERMPEAVAAEGGAYTLDPEGGDGRARAKARAGRAGKKGVAALDGMILPGKLPTRFSVDAYGLRDALGAARLRAEADHAHATRLDRHRGTMKGIDFRKYRAAIENYVPHVKEGNQTSLNAARVPFASYINRMHNQIHPIFADGFLASLGGHPDPRLANMKLVTHVEIILDGATGKLLTAGVVRPSGVTAFEVAALRSLEEASPYGKAPDVIVSPDGRVYVHWEFYRDPFLACTSQFARPYLLKGNGAAPTPTEPEPVPTPSTPLPGPDALPGGPQKFGLL